MDQLDYPFHALEEMEMPVMLAQFLIEQNKEPKYLQYLNITLKCLIIGWGFSSVT